MKTLKTIFIVFILSLTLSDAHTYQNQRGYRHSRRQSKPRRKFDHLMTRLHHAAIRGELGKIERLLESKHYRRKINDKNNQGQTPLHLAALKGNLQIVKLLIENGTDVNAQANDKKTALHLAAIKGHLEIIKLLIENGADVNAQKDNGEAALHMAVTQNHKNIIEIIEYLFQNDADITLTCTNKKNKPPLNNVTSLHATLLNNQPIKIIQLLVEHAKQHLSKEEFKTFINAQMSDGSTVLRIAITTGQIEVIKYLLKNGADITLANTMPATKDKPELKNVSPLHAALLSNQPFEIIQTLVEHAKQHLSKEVFKTFINAQTDRGDTALQIAVTQKQKETIKYLLKNNADITLTHTMPGTKDYPYDLKNVTSLYTALLSNQPFEIIQLLVEHAKRYLSKEEFKTFINAQTDHGDTALQIAVTQKQKEAIMYLLENGANPNIQNNNKIDKKNKIRSAFQTLIRLHEQSPIKYENLDAQRYSSKELCELITLFLEHGARIDLANKNNQTSLYWLICPQLSDELKVLIENSTQKNNLNEALKVEQTDKTDEFGKTIWETLEIFYNPEIIKILVDTKNKDGKTLIDIAREQNDQEVFVNLQNYRAVLDTDHYLRFRKVYPSLSQKRRYPDKEWFFGMINTLETQNRKNRPTIEIKKFETQKETTKKTYQLYKHNKLELRFDVDTQTLEYRRQNTKEFQPIHNEQVKNKNMFILKHSDKRKFYYWYQNNKLKFRQSGTQQTYNLKLKS